ncbi:hypothetical protein THRCLA_03868 [Thraustotheca clavata]|uniref:Uncharacterized protein n=1 Tax=Thraustotheca clavata TaxID=74557 RepID=A0A1W0A0Q5_9STRA|nr:hypothetical protein THRCLA_03868 [Thraustotheca clavata]
MDRHGLGRMGCTGCQASIKMKSIFQRNNKDKKKNIRCFPHCCHGRGGHKSSGFCGSSVFVTTNHLCDMAVCRFESSTIEDAKRIVVGGFYDAEFLHAASDYPVQEVATIAPGIIRFVVNPDVNKRGWSYAYDSRIEKNRRHRLSVYFIKRSPLHNSQCVDAIHSTWFELRSTRMPKHKAAELLASPQYQPKLEHRFPNSPNTWPHPHPHSPSLQHGGYLPPLYVDSSHFKRPLLEGSHTPGHNKRQRQTPFKYANAPPESKWSVFNPKWTILSTALAR